MELFDIIILVVVWVIGAIISLVFLAAAVWVVVKVLQAMGVL